MEDQLLPISDFYLDAPASAPPRFCPAKWDFSGCAIASNGVALIAALLVGAFIACLTGGTFASFSFLAWLNVPFFVGPVNGIVVSLILYVILAKAMKK